MRYKPKSTGGLQLALGGLPDGMPVEVDPDIRVSAKTVGELRKATTWPENLAVMRPQEHYLSNRIELRPPFRVQKRPLRRSRDRRREALHSGAEPVSAGG